MRNIPLIISVDPTHRELEIIGLYIIRSVFDDMVGLNGEEWANQIMLF